MRKMKYEFSYEITAFDLWKLSMYTIYSSAIGVCNIVFTIAALLLAAKFWGYVNDFVKILFILGISLFPIIQPAAIYFRAKKLAAAIPKDLQMGFDDSGIYIKSEKQNSKLKWNMVKGISKKLDMIVLFTTTKHGYIFTDNVLGKQKEDFYKFVVSKIDMKQQKSN